jgi:hypothetical protein
MSPALAGVSNWVSSTAWSPRSKTGLEKIT